MHGHQDANKWLSDACAGACEEVLDQCRVNACESTRCQRSCVGPFNWGHAQVRRACMGHAAFPRQKQEARMTNGNRQRRIVFREGS
jgi:hypothetical protein